MLELVVHKVHEEDEEIDHLLHVLCFFVLFGLCLVIKILVMWMLGKLVGIRELLDHAIAQVIVDVVFQWFPLVAGEAIFDDETISELLL